MESITRTIEGHLALPDSPSFGKRAGDRWAVYVDETPIEADAFAHSIARGLSDSPRWLDCRYLYDESGSEIFVKITEQPEYYPTRAEAEILELYAEEIAESAGAVPIVELGAGAATKTRHLLRAWQAVSSRPVDYVPIDIDSHVLVSAAEHLANEFSELRIHGLATSYERGLGLIAGHSPLCLVFLGSTIGNLNHDETELFFERIESVLRPGDAFLLGVDLVKDVEVLEAAYNDRGGYSEAFTRNMFARMNREIATQIPEYAIDHVAFWNDRLERIEIYARFNEAALVDLPTIERSFRIAPGEMILTEISRKYRMDKVEADLARYGFRLERSFTDSAELFALLLFRRVETSMSPPLWERLTLELQRSRGRTFDLIDALSDEQLGRQVRPFLSPILWDLGHIAEFEELWLIRSIDAGVGDGKAIDTIYDAIETPRDERGDLALPSRDELQRRLRFVREESLAKLYRREFEEAHPLMRNGFVYRMLAQHEAQHQETILQAVALMDERPYEPAARLDIPREKLPPDTEMVIVPSGAFPMGTDAIAGAYDNERPTHWVDVPPFWIDSAPVTNREFVQFIEAGSYERPELWCDEGWVWRQENAIEHPGRWRPVEGGWETLYFGHREPLVPTQPVMHVSWFEAKAYARFAGKRLPTEAEWEKAAAWDPEVRVTRCYPWGDRSPDPQRANLDAQTFAPAPVGAYPKGRSFYGCHQMIGDVWEWTSSEFDAYPGFKAFPYAEYSEVHFGKGYRVLRGGSWATASSVARNTFRNWDFPQRRQIFAGFRCARDP